MKRVIRDVLPTIFHCGMGRRIRSGSENVYHLRASGSPREHDGKCAHGPVLHVHAFSSLFSLGQSESDESEGANQPTKRDVHMVWKKTRRRVVDRVVVSYHSVRPGTPA